MVKEGGRVRGVARNERKGEREMANPSGRVSNPSGRGGLGIDRFRSFDMGISHACAYRFRNHIKTDFKPFYINYRSIAALIRVLVINRKTVVNHFRL